MELFQGWPILCFDERAKTLQELMAINPRVEAKAYELQKVRALAD
jgi:hypothetical protein